MLTLFIALLIAWGPTQYLIYLYSRRSYNCGSIYVDRAEQLLYCYSTKGEERTFHEQDKAITWLLSEANPPIQRAKIYILTKRKAAKSA